MKRFLAWCGKEFLELLPVWCFFLLIFWLLRLTSTVILARYHIHPSEVSFVVIGSLIVSKAVLIADQLKVTARFDEQPLFYVSLWKMLVYFTITFAFQMLDPMYHLARRHDLRDAPKVIRQDLTEPRFWVIQLWLVLLLFAYCSAREVIRAIGEKEFKALYFQKKKPPARSEDQSKRAA